MTRRPFGRVRSLGTALTLAVALTACSFHVPHRTPKDASPAPPVPTTIKRLSENAAHRDVVRRSSIENHGRFRLAIVEFDDQGQFWSRAQFDQAVADLKSVYAASAAGAQVMVFVHGWKHSANVCDSNLACFRELLASFADREGDGGRPVYGIYVGWRGLSVKGPLLKEFSFWGRKGTAHRVGSGDVVELLTTLEALHRNQRSRSPNTRLTIIGHSFGAAMVFSAVAAPLKERLTAFANKESGPARFVGFGTLTLLVNPAFEATLYQGIDAFLRTRPGLFDPRNPRVLVTVASEADTATRFAFPLGRFLGTLFQRSRGDGQRGRMLATVGNYAAFATHRLEPVKGPAKTPQVDRPCSCPSGLSAVFARQGEEAPGAFTLGSTDEDFGSTKLTRTGKGPQADSPLILVRADRRILPGHSDIWTPAFAEFIAGMIARTDALLFSTR